MSRQKRNLAAVLLLVAGAAGGIALFNTERAEPIQPPAPAAAPATKPAPRTPALRNLPGAVAPLGRADLAAAATLAADAYAANAPPPESNAALIGRDFVTRLPFGCAGRRSAEVATIEYNAERETLKLSAQPKLWGDSPWLEALTDGAPLEAAEGFWVSRPWLTAESCPAPAPPVEGSPPIQDAIPRETLGLVHLFPPGTPRTRLRGNRPYEVTRKAKPDEPRSYQLVLSGRITGFDGRPIRCWTDSADLRPICLFAVEFTRIAFENAATGSVVAEWKN